MLEDDIVGMGLTQPFGNFETGAEDFGCLVVLFFCYSTSPIVSSESAIASPGDVVWISGSVTLTNGAARAIAIKGLCQP